MSATILFTSGKVDQYIVKAIMQHIYIMQYD